MSIRRRKTMTKIILQRVFISQFGSRTKVSHPINRSTNSKAAHLSCISYTTPSYKSCKSYQLNINRTSAFFPPLLSLESDVHTNMKNGGVER